MLILALAFACKAPEGGPVDPFERLGAGEVRAAVVDDPAAFFAGIGAEAVPGDVLVWNDRVRFVIQRAKAGSYYIDQGGGVIDADIVRPEGQLGHDIVEEWLPMIGLGRLVSPDTVAVLEDGRLEGRARVVVEGAESPMTLITGVLGGGDLLASKGLRLRTEYVLEPDSWLLQVSTTVTAGAEEFPALLPGDLLMGAGESAEHWNPGRGRATPAGTTGWTGYTGKRADVAVAVFAPPGGELNTGPIGLLAEAADLTGGFQAPVDLAPGQTHTYTRLYGVGPDLATLTDAWLARNQAPTEAISGVVEADDGPVAGARVVILVDGEPYTQAVSGADGSFSAQVPAGAVATARAVGRGEGRHTDLPDGAVLLGPYSSAGPAADALGSLAGGAVPVPFAEGRGVAAPEDPLHLGVPGFLRVRSGDGLPFEVRARREGADVEVPGWLAPGRPSGQHAIAWSRDGEVLVPVEPGTYSLLAHRGIRFEIDTAEVEVQAGQTVDVTVDLPAAYAHPGWLLADPHSHASPSNDASVSMEDRLVCTAAVGVQLHFGTDHDHVVDYQPIVEALGLAPVLRSVIADEVSPVTRGHTNIYPLTPFYDMPNNGAFRWWAEPATDTQDQLDQLRARHGESFIFQANHPLDSGIGELAQWRPGAIGRPERWTDQIEAIEVCNAAECEDYTAFWLDLYLRGIHATPVAVSDSHGFADGRQGLSATFIGLGSDDPADYTDVGLTEAMRAGRVVASRGPFLQVSPDPGSVVAPGTTLSVQAHFPSWMTIDRLELHENGEVVEVVEGTEASFELNPAADAVYFVTASGDADLAPVWPGQRPWAMHAPIRVDVGGDGYTPPLPPLALEAD